MGYIEIRASRAPVAPAGDALGKGIELIGRIGLQQPDQIVVGLAIGIRQVHREASADPVVQGGVDLVVIHVSGGREAEDQVVGVEEPVRFRRGRNQGSLLDQGSVDLTAFLGDAAAGIRPVEIGSSRRGTAR